LAARGLLPEFTPATDAPVIASDGNALDLSSVFPRMFVRRHDHVTESDLSGDDTPLNDLSADVNKRTERYAAAYKELSALTAIFRAYVAAVHITRSNASVCSDLRSLGPLLESEKFTSRMPLYHPTELFITLVSFEYTNGRYRRLLTNRGSSLNGGIAIRARAYFEEALKIGVPTTITKIMNVQSALSREDASWQANGDWNFVALVLSPSPATGASGTPAPRASDPPAAASLGGRTQPQLLGQFGDWGAYTASSGRRKVCFALAKPVSAQAEPPNRPRDAAYIFIAARPADNVKNEVSVMFGYAFKPNAEASLEIGGSSFAMYTQSDSGWIKNLAEESRLVELMRKVAHMTVKGVSARGTTSADVYSLKGLAQALDRTAKECERFRNLGDDE
jgi:hypothetical protein